MVNLLEISKIQDKLNTPIEQVACASCNELATEANKMYIMVIRPHHGESYLPICGGCLEQLKLAFELETLK